MQITVRANRKDVEPELPKYVVDSKEAKQAAQILVGRILNLVERIEGRTPKPNEVRRIASKLVKDAA